MPAADTALLPDFADSALMLVAGDW